MKVKLICLLTAILLTACSPNPATTTEPSQTPRPSQTSTPIPTATPTPLPSPTSVPTPTPFPEPISGFLYDWPIPMLTEDQIQEVLDCQSETWSDDSWLDPYAIQVNDLVSACDFGLHAISQITDFDNMVLANAAKEAAQNAILQNPGIIFANPYFFFAFQSLEIVSKPPLISSPLEKVIMQYQWGGLGSPVNFELFIETDKSSIATGDIQTGPDYESGEDTISERHIYQELNSELVQTLGTSIVNLVPVKHQGQMLACFDNYPDWTITLGYQDGSELVLKTNDSNFFMEGGPFQTEVDGQNYVLASYEFNLALLGIINQLEIPLGEPAAMYCFAMPVAELFYTDMILP